MKHRTTVPLLAWGLLAAIVFVTLCPIGLRPATEISVNADRALAFALLGAVFALAYPGRWLWLLALLPLAAFGIEALQFLSATRHPHFEDAAFKALGAALGILAGRLAAAFLPPAPTGAETR
ncbi:hypothetical protein [Aurantimonas sp. Leaf443]|uniref:VanZ family protein n=1 Tax=Aurantimonas sp. Leaf443 TaxID=1736378 RepID=UPI000701FE8F|nr:hypothetical protein [Aurantimonas sp. Leaf443]KQT84026.1 hypothetical protein ASG48_11655 [Aurantimonas sp. Leaf443]